MTFSLKAGIALAALAGAAAVAGSASAADLGGNGGSIKDGYMAAMPQIVRGPAGPCYFRADVGYSVSQDPEVKWPVNNGTFTGDANGNGTIDANEITYVFVGDAVSNTSRENGAFGEVGAGCGSGSRGLRGEVMFGVHGDRKIDGEPLIFDPGPTPGDPVGPPPPPPQDDPLHTSIQSYTMMFNAYKDLGKYGNLTPYLGAGVGVAYHIVDETFFTGNPNLTNRIEGDRDLSFAWSLMAGVGYQISDRAILDVGYRYLDLGEAETGRVDNNFSVNPAVELDDLASHEIKIGLRYHFGQSDCCAAEYAPMK